MSGSEAAVLADADEQNITLTLQTGGEVERCRGEEGGSEGRRQAGNKRRRDRWR